MDIEANKNATPRYLDMWNTGDIGIADEVLAPGYVDYAHPDMDIATIQQTVLKTRAALPDFAITIDTIIAEGDMVAIRDTIRRTQNGHEIVSQGMRFIRTVDGKMVEMW